MADPKAPAEPALTAGDFPTATEADWRKLVDAVLKGGSFERLKSRSSDGLTIEPLYAPARQATSSDNEILKKVEAVVAQSEERQRREFTLRSVEMARDFEAQRRIDVQQQALAKAKHREEEERRETEAWAAASAAGTKAGARRFYWRVAAREALFFGERATS